MLNRLLRDEQGASAIEYSLLASLIAVALYAAIDGVGNEVALAFTTVEDKVGASTS